MALAEDGLQLEKPRVALGNPAGSTLIRSLILAALAAAVVAYFFYVRHHPVDFSSVRTRVHALESYGRQHTLALGVGFFATYVASTALSLPIAGLLTLAAGALFGLFEGVLLVSFASTIGATLAFLASRYVFREAVRRRFGERLRTVDEGMRREGALYLFAMRLVPVLPFFLVNLLMGLTALSARTFYWVSQVGMLAATVVYVNAGTRLAQLHSLSGLLSGGVLSGFLLLAAFPFIARRALIFFRRKRLYRRWPKPARFDRNLVVIGAGSAGLVSALIGATVRAKVTLVERHQMGGDCLNTGCVPSKALIHCARMAAQARAGGAVGVHAVPVVVDFPAVMDSVRRAIATVAPHDSVDRYRSLGVDVRRGQATIKSPWLVEVDGEPIRTRAIIIATGAEPIVPPIPGLTESNHVTSDTLWRIRELPQRLLVMGGGPIGCELAQAFARLGSKVTQIQRRERLLVREDEEVSEFVRQRLVADGVDVRTGCGVRGIERDGAGNALLCESAGGIERLPYDQLLIAVGRRPRTSGFGLEELGIHAEPTVATDEHLATVFPNIFACGDVAGPFQFTHTAAHQAWYAAVNALFGGVRRWRVDYATIPAVTFVDPEVARVGLNEREASKRGIAYEVTRYELGDLDRAIVEDSAHGFVKVLTPPGRDRILGVTIVGQHAGDLLAEFALAMRHGLGLGKILSTIHAYPTWAEANKFAAGQWKRAHAPERILRWLGRYHEWKLH